MSHQYPHAIHPSHCFPQYHSMETSKASLRDHSHSFSIGWAVFHPMPKANLTLLGNAPVIKPSPGHNCMVSESMLHTLSQNNNNQEADITNHNSMPIVLYVAPLMTTYSTYPPPTEPHLFHCRCNDILHASGCHGACTKTIQILSKDDDIIWSLQTQLAPQHELCMQYEVDLGTQDALVSPLTQQVKTSEMKSEKQMGVVRGWKKKVQELESMLKS